LEERIAFLEARMPQYAEDHFRSTGASTEASTEQKPETQTNGTRLLSLEESYSEDDGSSLVDGVAYLSLCASGTTETTPEPFYVGSSSGATIARMIQSCIFQTARRRASHAVAPPMSPPSLLRPESSARTTPTPTLEDHLSEYPPIDQARLLFNVFFDRLHTRWPILDRKSYTQLFELQYTQGALSIQQRSIFHLIYAISARFLQLMKKPCDVDPEVSA
jgi:hypothetical protein